MLDVRRLNLFEIMLKDAQSYYPNLKIDNVQLEHIFTDYFTVINEDPIWKPGSHKAGTDITCKTYGKISVKGGTFDLLKKMNQHVLKISSFRTSSIPTLEEKVEYIKSVKEDFVFSLARDKRIEDENIEYQYKLLIFRPLNVDLLEWIENGKGWKGIQNIENPTFKATIQGPSTSYQLWWNIFLENFRPFLLLEHDITIYKEDLQRIYDEKLNKYKRIFHKK